VPYDPKCYELAEHFLDQNASESMKDELAAWIQHHIELWLYDDREGAVRTAEQLGGNGDSETAKPPR
jgi:hypothetical protein